MAYSPDLTELIKWRVNENDTPDVGTPFALTRGTVAWHYNSSGIQVEAPINAKRQDYNPADNSSRGMLLEPTSASGYVRHSNNLMNTRWTISQVAGGGNADRQISATPAPDGTLTATDVSDTDSARDIYLSGPVPGGGTDQEVYTADCYVAKDAVSGTVRRPALRIGSSSFLTSDGAAVIFETNASPGPMTVVDNGGWYVDSGQDDYGDYWRVWITVVAQGTTFNCILYPAYNTIADGSARAVATQGTTTFAWAGITDDLAPGSFIATGEVVPLVRAADTYSNTAAPAMGTAAAGNTVYLDAELTDYTHGGVLNIPGGNLLDHYNESNSAQSNRVREFANAPNNFTDAWSNVSGGSIAQGVSSRFGVGNPYITAGRYKEADSRVYADGVQGSLRPATGILATMTAMDLGRAVQSNSRWWSRMWLRELRTYNTGRPDTGAGSLDLLSQGLVPEEPGPEPVANPYVMMV